MQRRTLIILYILGSSLISTHVGTLFAAESAAELATEKYINWQVKDFAIHRPLGGFTGNASQGKQLVINQDKGNCLACHSLPIAEEPFHGTVGPSLTGVASRLTIPQIRLRVVDEKIINPATIMPGYYRDPAQFNQIHDDFENRTMLTAQEVEHIVAFLATLK